MMNDFVKKLTNEVNAKIQGLFKKKDEKVLDLNIYSNFELPITYLENESHTISENIFNDLELTPSTINVDNKDAKSIYDVFLQPNNEFATNIMEKWKHNFTSNTYFIEDTQKIITNLDKHCHTNSNLNEPYYNCSNIISIWKNLKEDVHFLQKYHYMDWDIIKHLNHSKPLLQATSTLQIFSPVVSLALPILFIIFPFIILKLKGIPVTMEDYYYFLKAITKNHFFGVAINSFENFSLNNFIYLIASLGFFVFQVYQNINTCKKFYQNIKSINCQLIELRNYLQHSIDSMESFLELSIYSTTYEPFCAVTKPHLNNLYNMKKEIESITPFQHTFNKFTSMGQLLKAYYILYENMDYAESFKYSFGFNGYMDNLRGIYKNYIDKNIGSCKFSSKKQKFVKQYYPIIQSETMVKNDCDLNKNMIISSPNKSGKTTFLKTTLINIILSQQCGLGFYEKGCSSPYTHLHCYLNIPDTSARDSLFQAESRRCKDILDKIQNKNPYDKHFCIFDELYSGTNPDEATKAGIAFLKYLEEFPYVDFVLTTHYLNVCKNFSKSKHTNNYKMDVSINSDGTFDYLYTIKKGISRIKGATRVLKDMNYPKEIIDSIENS